MSCGSRPANPCQEDDWAKEEEERENKEAYLESQAAWWEKGEDGELVVDAFEDW